ncbi:hypothetical protein V8F06_009395 [Rhypophila decipiens]
MLSFTKEFVSRFPTPQPDLTHAPVAFLHRRLCRPFSSTFNRTLPLRRLPFISRLHSPALCVMASSKRMRSIVTSTDSPPSKRPCLIVEGDVSTASTASSSHPQSHPAETQPPPHATNELLGTVPTEIWHQVFQNLVPDPFKPIDQVYMPLRGIEQITPQHEFTESSHRHRTLLALSRTCRHLRPIAIPLLYRNILFGSYRPLIKLCRTLLEHPERGQHVQEITHGVAQNETDWELNCELLSDIPLAMGFPMTTARVQNTLILRNLAQTAHESFLDGDFVLCDNAGLFLLPILAMTPKILSLNIAGVWNWDQAMMGDPFMIFLMGFDPDESLGVCRYYLKYLLDLRLEPTGGTPVFPPPLLKDIRFFREEPRCENNQLLNHIRVLRSHECHKLREATQDMASVLDIPQDDDGNMLPSIPLRRISRSGPAEYMVIRKFLGKVRDLDANPFSWKQNPASTWPFWVDHMLKLELAKDSERWVENPEAGGYYGRDFLACLDKAVATSRHSATRLPLQSQAVTAYVGAFLHLHLGAPYPPETHELSLEMEQLEYLRREFLVSTQHGLCLSDCITSRFSNLWVLRMPLYIHKDNRKDIYVGFNPARFRHLQSLTLTVERLWGPVQRVLDMLERTEPSRPKISSPSTAGGHQERSFVFPNSHTSGLPPEILDTCRSSGADRGT